MNKTFEELGYKAGDTVRCTGSSPYFDMYKTGDIFTLELNNYGSLRAGTCNGSLGDWELVCDPSDLTWGDMTPEQQGALLLAHHQGKTIEIKSHVSDRWIKVKQPMFTQSSYCYRSEVVPVVVHHKRYAGLCKGDLGAIWKGQYSDAAYELTYDTEDGVPVCSSVKLSKLT
jgi:hypothetical protein